MHIKISIDQMSLTVKLICFLFALELCFCFAEDNSSTSLVETGFPVEFSIPPFKGKIDLHGQQYQIVRVIEFIVTLPNNQSNNTDPNKVKPVTTTKPKPKVTPIDFIMKVIDINSNRTICMGSLIRAKMVVSSASCFPLNTTGSNYKLLDIHNCTHQIVSIFRGTSFGNELALLILLAKTERPLITPIPLCNRQLQVQDNITMFLTKKQPRFLRTQIIRNSVCKQSYLQNESAFILWNMLCAHNSNEQRDCNLVVMGDPLLYEGRLCGVNVYGPSCVHDAVNGNLYTDIFKTLDFIKWMDDQANKTTQNI